MKFLGIDLAWTQKNESELTALEPDGAISDAGWTVASAETLSWISARADEGTLIFVDASLADRGCGFGLMSTRCQPAPATHRNSQARKRAD